MLSFEQAKGFALPTVLITSVVMMIVLLASLTGVSSISAALKDQYHNQIVKEAAESGLARARSCVAQSSGVITWSDAKPLLPNTDCDGDVITTCASQIDQACSVLTSATVQTSFSVGDPAISGSNYTVSSVGTLKQLRLSNSAATPTRTTSTSTKAVFDNNPNIAQVIDSGFVQVCGIFDGKTWCWGRNSEGSLGTGGFSDTPTLTPAPMSRLGGGLSGKTDKLVAVGNETACVVTTDNEIYCVGKNERGQLGIGSAGASNPLPQQVVKPPSMAGKTITKIDGGRRFFCVIASGDAYCWGSGQEGQLGIGTAVNQYTPQLITTNIGVAAGRTVTDISSDSSSYHACAVAGGKAYCWGYNGRGEVGDGVSTSDKLVPTAVNATASSSLNGKTVTEIVASGRYPITTVGGNEFPSSPGSANEARGGHACTLDNTGGIHCWGADQYGQLGQGAVTGGPSYRRAMPVRVTLGGLGAKVITNIGAANYSSCGLIGSENNSIYCWGRNDRGQLGRGSGASSGVSYPTPGLVVKQTPGISGKTVTDLKGGENRYCILTADDRSYCWGVNSTAGQIGDGTTIDRTVPTEATMLYQLKPFILF